ncbi:hypothetical protein [Neomegalonema sp.]|uniref:hypothetical protein n=1 Tax=Neomegalonema sp. TaxID=2039713 RepID=UPI00262643DE|nr:hypothetical protein [Neomegalonema sp.]MDD2869673.1 hypothetical protein [Neomegalonema sp.]
MSRVYGGGDGGNFITRTFIPDTAFKAEIVSLVSSGTNVVGKLVQIATSDGYTVTSPAANAKPDGDIIAFEKDATNTYLLTCRIWGYTDSNSVYTRAVAVKNFAYSGTPSLGYQILVSSGTYHDVVATSTTGIGKILEIDTPSSGFVDVII